MQISDIKQIELELTSRCNAGCPECPRTFIKNSSDKILHLNDIKLDNLKKWLPNTLPVERIKLSGNLGDAGIHPQLIDFINYFGTFGNRISIAMHTNGGMRDEKFWTTLGKISYEGQRMMPADKKFVFTVRWAIDGLEDTNHLYRINVNWQKLMRNLKAYLDAGGKAEWHFINFPHNEHQEDDVRKLAESLGMEFVTRKSVRNVGKKVTKNHSKAKDFGKLQNASKKVLEAYAPTVVCQHLKNESVFIASNETLWPCCMLWDENVKTENLVTKVPDDANWNNLNTNTMQQILNSAWYQNIENYWYPGKSNFINQCVKKCALKGTFTTEFERNEA